ncbi:MAG: BMP family ABC transporter substrate-binding protein [Anaerolinea sp.]|jgi:basic membrane protein A|nr:BMP family ABC transporter substrate-binding protein [Anaerolinea sp.]
MLRVRLSAFLALLVLVLAACGQPAPSPAPTQAGGETPGATSAAALRVAMIIAQGGLGDQSYNDLANEGLTRAEQEFGIEAQRVESPDIVSQGEAVLRQAGTADFDVVIDLEWSTAEALTVIAPEFADTRWTFMNFPVNGDNVTSFVFAEHEGSYLAGALAALVTSDTAIPGINPEKVIGVIGGTKSTGIDKFLVGFIQGARDVDPDVEVLTSYTNDFGDAAKGQQAAEAMFEQGADIVFQVAGGAGLGVIQAAADAGVYAIGVDTDQSSIAPAAVLTSMIKRTDLAVYESVKRAIEGTLSGGETVNLDLAAGGVELGTIHPSVPQEYLDRVDELRQQIVSGQIKVWNVIEQGYPDFLSE